MLPRAVLPVAPLDDGLDDDVPLCALEPEAPLCAPVAPVPLPVPLDMPEPDEIRALLSTN